MLNPDYRDMLCALNDAKADYLVVGAYAVAAHGIPRMTGDIDIWVRPTPENAQRVWQALLAFGAPTSRLKATDFCEPDIVFQMGFPPHRIDILTSISGVAFDDAWPNRIESELDGVPLAFLGKADLLKNKRATGRPKDIADVAYLEADE